jgi:hypothetical protein
MRRLCRTGKLLLFLFLLTPVCAPQAYADDEIYTFPRIEPYLEVEGGFRFVDLDGSERAREYDYLRDSVAAGLILKAFPFPHRIYLEADVLNKEDYFGDISYAYRDIVLSRWIQRSLFHNLENITLVDLEPTDPSTSVDVRDSGERYGVQTQLSDFFLRLKTPDFPFHVYLDGRVIHKEGSVQQRFQGGSGYFNDIVRVSDRRDIDWETQDITVGANSHINFIEADVSHTEKRFDSSGDKVLSESYTASSVRDEGVFPHNIVSELEGSTNTLKLHTMSTGSLAASVTLSKTDRENLESGTTADHLLGAGEVMWRPWPVVTFSAKYRHREKDVVNPDTLPAQYLGFVSYATPTTGIRDSISTDTDTVSGRAKFRVLKRLYFALDYTYKETERENADEWSMPDKSTENSLLFSASAKLPNKIKLKGDYTHKNIGSPAYNSQPENSDTGSFSLSWTPVAWAMTFASYKLSFEDRDSLFEDTVLEVDAENRNVKKQKFAGNVTFIVLKGLSITAGYAYMDNSVRQDLVYDDFDDPDANQHLDTWVKYGDRAQNYILNAAYSPLDKLFLSAGVSYTKSWGAFDPEDDLVTSFSEIKLREAIYTVSGEYEFRAGWGLGLSYEYADFDNLDEDPENLFAEDGTAHSVTLTASKKW